MKHSFTRFRWVLLALVLLPLTIHGATITIIPRESVVTGNALRTGERIDVDGIVEGDAFLFGETVTVNGTVKGDVIALAGKVVIAGTVGGSVRAAGQDVTITGTVGRNVTVAGQRVVVSSDATVGESIGVGAQDFEMLGTVAGSVDGGAGSAVIGGTIAKDLNVHTDVPGGTDTTSLLVKSTAVIGGAVVHTGSPVAQIEDGAKIAKGVTEKATNAPTKNDWQRVATLWSWAADLGLVVIGLIGLWLFRRQVVAISEEMRRRPGMNALLGLAVLVLTPIVLPLIFFTLIGVPLAILLAGVYTLALFLTKFFIALFVGDWLVKYAHRRNIRVPHSRAFAFIVGMVAVYVVFTLILGGNYQGGARVLNVIGSSAWFIALLWALGSMVRGSWRELRQNG